MKTKDQNHRRHEHVDRDGSWQEREAESANASVDASLSRRRFLEAAGFSMSVAAIGCGRAPVETAHPLVVQPEGFVPGRTQLYASTCAGCPAGCGLLAGVRDGRPLKMEGMPEHPLSAGGLCAIGQALPLGLYDSRRLSYPLADGEEATWEAVDNRIQAQLVQHAQDGAVVVLTPTVTSPSLQATIDAFLQQYPDGRHVVFDAVSSSAILDAHKQTHGARVLPRYRFDRASDIVSFGADFLGTWISPVEFTAGWRKNRIPTAQHGAMSYHVQFEGRMSLTGSNADRRIRLPSEAYAAVLSRIAAAVGSRMGLDKLEGPTPADDHLSEDELAALVDRLCSARGQSLVVSDSQDVEVQCLINYINHALDNYGKTLDIQHFSRQRQGNDADVKALLTDIAAGKISALFVAGSDLTHNLPGREALVRGLANVPLVVSCSERVDDFSSLAHFVCPDHHPLESWMDAEAVSGLVSISQPTLRPLGNTRSLLESLHRWTGGRAPMYKIVKTLWQELIHPRAKTEQPFQAFWDKSVHDGFAEVETSSEPHEFQVDAVKLSNTQIPAEGLFLSLYSKVGLTDSRHAHNPWLQELPDPVTKVTWDNYVCLSPQLAADHDLKDGDMVRVESEDGVQIELPAFIQPGQHDRVVAIALGYGVRGTDRFAQIGPQWLESRPTVEEGALVGKNAAALLEFRGGNLQQSRQNIALAKAVGRRELASTQQHHTLEMPATVAPQGAEVRHIVQETTLGEFAKNPHAGTAEVHHEVGPQLWSEDHPKQGRHWGMVIDLNCCTGCSACLIACQSENNVPVVGKDEVLRQREMHWIRVDRYYSGNDDDLSVAHQPMMCHHCDNAPCETVCPVLATVHGEEGLNEQAYNRCVGTRYCANNCPYKVRRFNWFKYEHADTLQNLALNPDVTVRGRGVMEKCSLCVQRIEDGKLEARRLGQPLADGAVQTACQQSCPAQAIVFGDMNSPDSRIHAALDNPRRYGVLEEFNFRPSVSYQRMVRNRDDVNDDQNHSEGSHHA